MAKRKQTSIDLQTKLKILEEVDRDVLKKSAIAEKYGLPKSTLSTILKDREKILNAAASGSGNKSKRFRSAKYEDVETLLLEWFNHMRASNVPLSGPIIQSKANEIAKSLDILDFSCSAGWLYRFQKRHSISSLVICGEANKVDEEGANNWLREFDQVREKYASCDVYNMDETGLFYNLFPSRTLGIKGDKCHGGGRSKQRLTVVLVCNADGSDKHRPWVIGKSEKPRCFKNINVDSLPCIYSHHKKAWIDSSSFRKWLLRFNNRMVAQNRHVLLTLDRCTAHNIHDLNLTNVKVHFFPPNATSRLQPLDQGIIALMKRSYRKRLVRAAIRAAEKDMETPTWSVLDAVKAIAASWESVSSQNIQNCFTRAWRHTDANPVDDLEGDNDSTLNDEWNTLQDVANPGVSFEEFVSADDDVAVCAPVESGVQAVVSEVQEMSSEESEEDNIIPPTRQDVLHALETLERFAATSEVTANFTEAMSTVGREVTRHFRSHLRQRNIQEFFTRK